MATDFSFLVSVQTDSEAEPTYHPVGIARLFPEGKAAVA
jgi:hypothetical protein